MTLLQPRVADVFCGGGGFSLGTKWAGAHVAVSVDVDKDLTYSHSHNFRQSKLLLEDIRAISGRQLIAAAGGRLDGIVGGPPCQGFSSIGKRRDDDPRRRLLDEFFRLVDEVRPSFFIMENVVGLTYTDAKPILEDALSRVGGAYQVLGPVILNAADFGAATTRRRVFVFGIHRDRGDPLSSHDLQVSNEQAPTVRDAIGDLMPARFEKTSKGFEVWRTSAEPSAYAKRLRSKSGIYTDTARTLHSKEVARRFSTVAPGTSDSVGRHYRLSWSGHCPTLRAGTGVANGSYQSVRPIHPEEPRVITVREAARLQGFPDSFLFHPATWHSFRMIGNSVSPVQARSLVRATISRFR